MIDGAEARTSTTRTVVTRVLARCGGRRSEVHHSQGWRTSPDGRRCDNVESSHRRDRLSLRFAGPDLALSFGRAAGGGVAVVAVDGHRVGRVRFAGPHRRPHWGPLRRFGVPGSGPHRVVLTVLHGNAYVAGFVVDTRRRHLAFEHTFE